MRRIWRAALVIWLAVVSAAAAPGPRRIVSLSPNTTEILYGIGAFDRVVGVTVYDKYPPAVSKLPRVGGWQNSNIEKIVELHPDLVVLTQAQVPFIADQLKAFGLKTAVAPSQSLADVFSAIQVLGAATGNEREAAELSRKTRAALDDVRARTRGLAPRTVLLAVSRTPGALRDLYVATQGSFLIDLVEIAGGRSVTEPGRNGYARISKEAIVALDPELILDLLPGLTSPLGEDVKQAWSDLPELRAVRNGRVYAIHEEFVGHPSQFIAETAKVFARIIHPEAYSAGRP